MNALLTDLLDMLGLIALAVGVVCGLWPSIGGFAICAGAAVLLGSSWLIDQIGHRRRGDSP